AGPARCSSRCWSTGATGSSRSAPTTWARTCRPATTRTSGWRWPRPTARTPCIWGVPSDWGYRVNKHLLSIHDVSAEDVVRILDTADSFREVGTRVIKKVPALRGRTVVNLFYENSTRTRISFELAAKRLSADVINVSADASSVKKGESLRDTARTLLAMGADAIVLRHPAAGAPALLARWVDASVINAGDG